MQYISDKFLSDGSFFHWSLSLLFIYNPQLLARSFIFFVDVKCKYKVKLLTKNSSFLDHIRVRRSK